MLFRKKMTVAQYCDANLVTLFSREREDTWEKMRRACDDPWLNAVDKDVYYIHMRAILIELMLIAITKSCAMRISSDAYVHVEKYLSKRNLSKINALTSEYSNAFGTIGTDGVEQMALRFTELLTGGRVQQATAQRFFAEFYSMLKVFFDDFKNIKLVLV